MELTVSPAPHIHDNLTVSKCMYNVIIALLPAFAVSLYFFGIGALIVTLSSILSCVIVEYLIQKYLLKEKPSIGNGSAILTGLLLAFNLPSNLPIWIVVIGSIVAIGIAKMSFGGLGNNLFNPALAGRVFLLISFPTQMTQWPRPIVSRWNYTDTETGATLLSKLKEESIQRSSSGTKGQGFHVKKSGDATVVLVGFPSVGKSTLLNELTNAESKVGAYQFTTLDIVPGVMEYKNAKIQVFDIPGIITGASSGKGRGREILSVARTAELIIVVLDVLNPQHLDVILKELRNIGIRPNERPPDVTVNRRRTGGVHVSSTVPLTHLDEKTIRSIINEYGMHNADVLFRDDVTMDQFIDVLDRNKSYVPMLILLNKVDLVDKAYLEEMKKQLPEFIPISADKKLNIDNLKETIFENLNLVRVYLKPQGRKADMNDPLVIKKGSTVIDACDKLHKEFVKNFRHAKIWGTSVKFPGQKVGPDHVLEDEDVLRIILKK